MMNMPSYTIMYHLDIQHTLVVKERIRKSRTKAGDNWRGKLWQLRLPGRIGTSLWDTSVQSVKLRNNTENHKLREINRWTLPGVGRLDSSQNYFQDLCEFTQRGIIVEKQIDQEMQIEDYTIFSY